MKKLILISLLFCCSVSFAQTATEDAIKKICTAESQAFQDHDLDALAKYHVQSADEQLAWNNPDGTYGFETGWQKISDGLKDWFNSVKKDDAKVLNDNFAFTIKGEMAFVAYNSRVQIAGGKMTESRENRTLLLMNGKWKILAVQAYSNHNSGK